MQENKVCKHDGQYHIKSLKIDEIEYCPDCDEVHLILSGMKHEQYSGYYPFSKTIVLGKVSKVE